MLNYIIRRTIWAIIVIIGVSIVTFMVIELSPGDFVTQYENQLMNQSGMSATEAEAAGDKLRERYGLDSPLYQRYGNWIIGIVTEGDFGPAMAYGGKEVSELIAERLPRTLLLALLAHLISSVIGIGMGIYIAPRQYKMSDNLAALAAFFMTSAPPFCHRLDCGLLADLWLGPNPC